MTSLPSACCCTLSTPVQKERTKAHKRVSGNSSHGSKCKIHSVASTTAWKGKDWLEITGTNVPNNGLLPPPLSVLRPDSPTFCTTDHHQQLLVTVHPLTYSWSLGSSHCLRRQRKRNQNRAKLQAKLKVSCSGRTRDQVHSALKSRILLEGFSKVNTPKTQVL